MAIPTQKSLFDPLENMQFQTNVQEFDIGGKLLTVSYRLNHILTQNFLDGNYREEVKKEMAEFMARYILENNLAEFTSMDDPLSQTKILNMRCYLAPNDQVKILRVNYAGK